MPYTSKGHGTYPRFLRGDFLDIMGTPYICMVLNPIVNETDLLPQSFLVSNVVTLILNLLIGLSI